MRANPKYANQSNEFWSCVKLISQKLGYSQNSQVMVPSQEAVLRIFGDLKLSTDKIIVNGDLTKFGSLLFQYFKFRAEILNDEAQHQLMDVDEAKALFKSLQKKYRPKCPLPMNKQKGEKRSVAFFTAIINTLIEANVKGVPTVYDPRQITAFTKDNFPARSLSRRVDGSFPNEINPIAIWEIKEYYYTTTFGSRIADGVYETMLDGYELKDARTIMDREVYHYLMIDSHRTWWKMGIPYLCRIVDMLHMGLITECLFGREVVDRIPKIVAEWLVMYEQHKHEYQGGTPEVTIS